MNSKVDQLIERIAYGILRSAPKGPWESIDVELTGAGGMLGSNLTVNVATGVAGTTISIDDDTEDAFADLREVMYRAKVGTWYNCRLSLGCDNSVVTEFDYDSPPFRGEFAPELLINDQADFPRDGEHLPNWHPAKSRGPSGTQ